MLEKILQSCLTLTFVNQKDSFKFLLFWKKTSKNISLFLNFFVLITFSPWEIHFKAKKSFLSWRPVAPSFLFLSSAWLRYFILKVRVGKGKMPRPNSCSYHSNSRCLGDVTIGPGGGWHERTCYWPKLKFFVSRGRLMTLMSWFIWTFSNRTVYLDFTLLKNFFTKII